MTGIKPFKIVDNFIAYTNAGDEVIFSDIIIVSLELYFAVTDAEFIRHCFFVESKAQKLDLFCI